MNNNPCKGCSWYDSDLGCMCSSLELWYQCPLEPEPTEDDFLTEKYGEGEGEINVSNYR